MIRYVLVGGLVVTILYVVVQTGSADRISQGGGILTRALNRFLSPTVALVPDRTHPTITAVPHAGKQSGGTGGFTP